MVKSVLVIVVLVIGYLDVERVLANIPNDVDIFSEELMSQEDQLLPTKVEVDYQNDENVELTEGSGSGEDTSQEPEVQDTDKSPPEVSQDAIAKEHDDNVGDENNEQEEIVEDNKEEELEIPQVVEEQGVISDETVDNTKVIPSENEDDTSKIEPIVNEDYSVNVETSNEQDNTSQIASSIEQVATSNDEDNSTIVQPSNEETNSSKAEEQVEIPKVDASNETDNTSKPDTIEDINLNKSVNNSYEDRSESESADKADIQDRSDNSSAPAVELEPQETVQDTQTKTDQDEEEHSSNIALKNDFPNEKSLPAERFGNTRGLGKSMPMQEAKTADKDEIKKSVDDEQKEQESPEQHNNSNEKVEDLPNVVGTKTVYGELEDQKEIEDAGASSASSGSNTVTFVIILGIVGIVGIVGFFIHKKRKATQRATSVPTHEDRELKEVKTHRPNDSDGGGQKKVFQMPEANPLILKNAHFTKAAPADTELNAKNGHLPTGEKQFTTTLPVTKSKEDDIRMMDDDVEDEGAERRPLVLTSFQPNNQTGNIITKVEQQYAKPSGIDDRWKGNASIPSTITSFGTIGDD